MNDTAIREDEVQNLWSKYENNPVLSVAPNSINFGQLAPNPGGGWYFFGIKDANISRWESVDLITWSNETVVLSNGGVGAWDRYLQVVLAFQKLDASWMMLYRGYSGAGGSYKIGRATSADGTTWTKEDNGGVDDGLFPQFDDNYDPTGLILVDGTYYLYTNGDGGHGVTNLYTSPDLDTWTAHASNPIFKNGFCSYVWKYDGNYYMVIPRDIDNAGSDLYDHVIALYRCATPIFTPANREYLGCAIVNDQEYDDRYLDTPSLTMTDIYRDTNGTEFGTTLWMMYSGDFTVMVQAIASTTLAELAALTPIPETGSEL